MKSQNRVWVAVLASLAVCVLVAATCQGRSRDLLTGEEPALQWEYKSLGIDENRPFDAKEFNALGAEGWDFAGSYKYSKDFPPLVIFKRPVKK